MNDRELMASVRKGDTQALGSLVERYRDRIVRFLHNFTGDYELASDLAQESFVRVYTHAGKYREDAAFSTWLYRIGINMAIDELRRRNRFRWVPFLKSDDRGRERESLAIPAADHPEQSLLTEERKRLTRKAVNALPRRYRAAVVLRDIEELSYEETARVLNCPLGTVKSRVKRGRMLLKSRLDGLHPAVAPQGNLWGFKGVKPL
jgi:RNA polymerase sigma-70 factor (ECF subfamily)